MELVHEFDYHGMLKPPAQIGGPLGTRMFFEVTGDGWVEGKRLRGRVLTGGGDWLLIAPDGLGRLDVRAQFETDDGAVVYVQYDGILEMNDAFQKAMASASGTEFADQYFRTPASGSSTASAASPEAFGGGHLGEHARQSAPGAPQAPGLGAVRLWFDEDLSPTLVTDVVRTVRVRVSPSPKVPANPRCAGFRSVAARGR